MRKWTVLLVLCCGCWLGPTGSALAQAPSPGQSADVYAHASKQNAAMLQRYNWTMRIALTVNGEPKPPQLYRMRHDRTGQVQETPLTAEKPKSYHGRRGRIEKKKADEARQYIEAVAQVVKQYVAPTPEAIMKLFSHAQAAPQPDGTVLITGTQLIQQGDAVSFVIDAATRQPKTFNFSTQVSGDTVIGAMNFVALPHGPCCPDRITVLVPSKGLEAQVQHFNYVLQQP
jgi:hypothetical protein